MLKELNEEQLALLDRQTEEWLAIGLSTERINEQKCIEAMELVYKCGGLDPPKHYYFVRSPLEGSRLCKYIRQDGTKAEHEQSPGMPETWCYGSNDASWVAHYDTFRKLGVEVENIDGIVAAAKTCGWFIPCDVACIISDRPEVIHMVDERLHCEDGPAIRFTDGFSVWSIGGVQVDEQIVMEPHTQTIEQIMSEENEEVKRVRIERYGWEAFLQNAGAEQVDTRENPIEYTKEALFSIDGMKVLVCACPSTGRVYSLEVDPDVTTCDDAQAYLSSGLSKRIVSAS